MISVSTDIQVSNSIKPGLLCHSVLLNIAVVAQVLSQWFLSLLGDRSCLLWLCEPHFSTKTSWAQRHYWYFSSWGRIPNSCIVLGLGRKQIPTDSQHIFLYIFWSSNRMFPNWLTFCKRFKWNRNITLLQSLCQGKLETSKREVEWLSLIKMILDYFIQVSIIYCIYGPNISFPLDIGRSWSPRHVNVPFSHVVAIDE